MSQDRADAFREAAEIAHDMCLKKMQWRKLPKIGQPNPPLTPIPGGGQLAGALRGKFLEMAEEEEAKEKK